MEKAYITFLGTGSAIPTKRRSHPSVLLRYKDENILVDCGEGTQRQFRISHTNPCKLTRILITHWHGDHVLGLPGLFQTLMLNGYNKTLHIYGPKGTKRMIEMYKQMFTHKDLLQIETHELASGKAFETKDFLVECQEMNHETPTLAYAFILKEKSRLDKQKIKKLKIPDSPILGELAKGKTIEFQGKKISGKSLVYREPERKISFLLDTQLCKSCQSLAENSDLLIAEATYAKEEIELAEQHFHLTSEQTAEIAKKAKVKKLILMHLSQRYENAPKIILDEAKKIFKNTTVAEDFDKITI